MIWKENTLKRSALLRPQNRDVVYDDFVIAVAFPWKMKREKTTNQQHRNYSDAHNNQFIDRHYEQFTCVHNMNGNIEKCCESFELKSSTNADTHTILCVLFEHSIEKLSCIIELIKIAADGE